jgi:hypothetical protein
MTSDQQDDDQESKPTILVPETDTPDQSKGSKAALMTIDAEHTPYFVPTNMAEAGSLAKSMIEQGVVPEAYKEKDGSVNVGKVRLAMLAGMELGLAPIQAVNSIYIVRGALTVWGKGAKALIARTGTLEDYRVRWVDNTTMTDDNPDGDLMAVPSANVDVKDWPSKLTCLVIAKRHGVATPFRGQFSVGQAMRAGLWNNHKKKPWIKYPEDMLEHKAAARVWDRGFADCLKGIAIREIVEEKDERLGGDRPKVNTAFTGVAQTSIAATTITPETEAEKLIAALPKLGTLDAMKSWSLASEGTMEWIAQHKPELAMKVAAAAETRRKELEAANVASDPKA